MPEITVNRHGHKFTAEIFDDFGPIHLERLRKLASFLDTLPPEKFDLEDWVTEVDPKKRHPCGTVCCAVGWLPVVDKKNWKWVSEKRREYNNEGGCVRNYRSAYPKLRKMRGHGDSYFFGYNDTWASIEEYFSVTEWGADKLFQSEHYSSKATPKMVASRLRHFANAAEAHLAASSNP